MDIKEFKEIDSTFNESMFITKINNVFIKLFTAIMLDNLDNVKHFIGDEVYKYAKDIIDKNKEKNHRQMYDELNVKDSKIVDILVNESVYNIKVLLQSRYMDYIISLDDGSLVSGNNSSRRQVNYELTFTKRKGALTQGIVRKCPNCGATMSVNNSGRCEYCNSIYNQEDYDWVLTELKVLN